MAAKKTKFLLLFFLVSTILLTAKASQEESSRNTHDGSSEVNVSGIVSALEEKGYKAMSSTLNNSLTSLLSNQNATSFTIFCPTDVAFASLREVQSPMTSLGYHVSPYYLPREDLELRTETLRMYSGINTLLPGNSLVVTSQVPHLHSESDFEAELNLVKIVDWNIYSDGQVIVHGILDFFDPAAQAIIFPLGVHMGRVGSGLGTSSHLAMARPQLRRLDARASIWPTVIPS
ncbi:uncharacterized protein LOC119996967 [Tripterygium wilfordii]|uniref:uncharacterized protein LOC119996967 n=1 Tax=Tripterygium wilfordii TaxID=458696 RepID=UPI0018F842D3|nr:uncharacterized protein LOC119996967 [Tripterygium wilfordii]